jgi:hypothetical protein
MRTGVLLPSSVLRASSRDLVAWARTAEDTGFDSLGVRGRIVHDSLEPLVALSLVAAATRRIELVLHLPALHLAQPRILARQIGSLDRASRGRLNVAVDAWTFTGRDGRRRCLTVVDVRETGSAALDGVREVLDTCERAGADDVLLGVPSGDLRQLERLAGLRDPARV